MAGSERAATLILCCLLVQLVVRWGGRPASCSLPWICSSSSGGSSTRTPAPPAESAAPAIAAATAGAALPDVRMPSPPLDDVWRGDVPGEAANSSAAAAAVVSWQAGSRHFVHEPFSWRRNRKKITELTVREPTSVRLSPTPLHAHVSSGSLCRWAEHHD